MEVLIEDYSVLLLCTVALMTLAKEATQNR